MNSNNSNRPNDGVLGELESVKDTLHAVDGNIESILSMTADSDIPILEDVVNSIEYITLNLLSIAVTLTISSLSSIPSSFSSIT